MAEGSAPSAAACVGLPLDDIGGRTVGRIEALLADPLDSSPTWLVVRTRRFGRRATVPAATVATLGGRAWAPYPRETIRASSEIDCAAGLTCRRSVPSSARSWPFPGSTPAPEAASLEAIESIRTRHFR